MWRFCSVIICSLLMFTGCGMMNNLTTNANLTQTQVQLSSNNYHIVKQVVGEATDTYILGIGGLGKAALANTSYANMLQNANLQGSQAIIHSTTSEKVRNILVWTQRTVVTTGLVIEFDDVPNMHSGAYRTNNIEEKALQGLPNPYSSVTENNEINVSRNESNQLWGSIFVGFDYKEFEKMSEYQKQKKCRQIFQILMSRCKELKNNPQLVDANIDVLNSDIATFEKMEDPWFGYVSTLKRNLAKIN